MRSLEQIKNEMIDDILSLRNDVRLVEGDTTVDVTISAPAAQFYRYEVLLELEDRTRNLDGFIGVINDESFKTTVAQTLRFKQDGTPYTVDDVNDLISARLDAYVSDWNIIRNAGTSSTGIVRVFLATAGTVAWNSATQFTNTQGVTYVATSSVSGVTPNFDPATGLYYVDITVASTVTGETMNATAGSVTAMDPKPANFSYCTNPSALDGGSDRENDLDLIARAQEAWEKRVNGSLGAYERMAEAEAYVDDSYATDRDNDEEAIYLGSPCDVFAQFSSEDTEMVEETLYWPGESNNTNEEQFDIVLANQPVIDSFTPIVFKYATGGAEEQVVPDGVNTVVEIVKDTGNFYESVKATDKIRIRMALDTASYQRRLRVLYVYDKNPYKLQSVFDDVENRMVGPSALVRKAVEVPLRIIVEVQVAFGYAEADVQANITSNIQAFFNGGTTTYGKQYARKNIGEDIQHSDIADIILRTAGVVSYDTDTFFVVNTLNGYLGDPTPINNNQYAALHDVLFEYSTFNLSNFNASFTVP